MSDTKNKKTGAVFDVLQRVGRSFMLPIALLPIAGLLLGIGSSFTNPNMISSYKLENILGEGTFLHFILSVMSETGSIVFENLPILFAMGVALGMARNEKGTACLSAAIAFFIMHQTISTLLFLTGRLDEGVMAEGTLSNVVGIRSLEMGVFGGIIVGLGTAALHNRFYKIRLPAVLSFFGGTRFIPIISAVTYIFVGVIMFFVWPAVQSVIFSLGNFVLSSGYFGTFIYGAIERALIPFGLHHVFYLPFWQTGLGGSLIIDGQLVSGAQNIFFAELASSETLSFSVSATRFMSGKFPLMIFGLPGAALAMYKSALPSKKKVVGSLLLSAALTSALTGITEPIEFTFLFVAPLLYVIHCVFAGLSYMFMHILNVGVGMTFSGGVIDLTLFGILQGNEKTRWINIILVGIPYFVIYYLVFSLLIKKYDFKTPGKAENDETKLYTRADYRKKKESSRRDVEEKKSTQSEAIISALGGRENIVTVDSCATRLRVTVKDSSKIDRDAFTRTGASGVIAKGTGIQIVYGPTVSVIKSEIDEYLSK